MFNKETLNSTSYRKTCRRYNEAGHAHAVTFSCFRRQPFLSRDRSRQWLIEAIDRARKKHAFHVWAYVIMPEHSHLLIYPIEEEYDISAVLASIKKSVANRAMAFVGKHAPDFLARMRDEQPNGKVAHRFWQRGGGYDRNLWSPRYIWKMIDYIHDNPVRRGLCDTPADWYWSSAADYQCGTPGPLRVEMSNLPDDPRGGGD
jgi:putative transposase